MKEEKTATVSLNWREVVTIHALAMAASMTDNITEEDKEVMLEIRRKMLACSAIVADM